MYVIVLERILVLVFFVLLCLNVRLGMVPVDLHVYLLFVAIRQGTLILDRSLSLQGD